MIEPERSAWSDVGCFLLLLLGLVVFLVFVAIGW